MTTDAGVICSDTPLKPQILMWRTLGKFSQGENISIQCSSPKFYTGATSYLYKVGESAHIKTVKASATSNSVTFTRAKINTAHEGYYICTYQLERDGRNYTSEKSDQVKVIVIDKPPKPTIEILRPTGAFSIGETANIKCSTHDAYSGVIFILSKVESNTYITSAVVKAAGFSTILTVKDISSKDQGDYVCLYQIKRSGKLFNSTQSDHKRVAAPSSQSAATIWPVLGSQSADIQCSAPKVYTGITFTLHKVGSTAVVASFGPTSNTTVILKIRNMRSREEGSYTCMYQASIWGRSYTSARSELLNVTLARQPEGPKLTVTTLFGLFVQGKSVRITCLAPEYYTTNRFHLIKNGKATNLPWIPTQWAHHGAEFRIANTTVSDSGNYTCIHETEINGNMFNSTYSNFVVIAVSERVEIRLMNGSSICSGRVEILNNKTWGTVCDDQWQLADAQIVCRELRCGTAVSALTHTYFGKGTGPIVLDDLDCRGTELFLWQCPSRHWGQHNCHHEEDAGVICSGPKTRLSVLPDYDVFVKGESLTLKCTLKSHNASKRLEFLRNSVYLSHQELNPEDISATLNLRNIGEGDQGDYTCHYVYLEGDQWIHSTPSDPVQVTITDKLGSTLVIYGCVAFECRKKSEKRYTYKAKRKFCSCPFILEHIQLSQRCINGNNVIWMSAAPATLKKFNTIPDKPAQYDWYLTTRFNVQSPPSPPPPPHAHAHSSLHGEVQQLAKSPTTAPSKPVTSTTEKVMSSRSIGTTHAPLRVTHHRDLERYQSSCTFARSKSWNSLRTSTMGVPAPHGLQRFKIPAPQYLFKGH
ncbi:uncharacterized protein [Heterodontus francisci]|uniref:uncharacterized protein n=1 Tax=Heterodontus francisci TaxID=7792 RepID=UPI00355B611E